MLKEEGFKDRKELSEAMFDTMKKYGGIGLSANQVGLPFNMFVFDTKSVRIHTFTILENLFMWKILRNCIS